MTTRRCLSFGSKLVDLEVSKQLCEALQPLAIDAAQRAFHEERLQHSRAADQAKLAVKEAQYEADRAFEQFDLVDPRNRLVADTLEERLNDRLTQLQSAKKHHADCSAESKALSPEQKTALIALSRDFVAAWENPQASPSLKKRITRAAVAEVIVTLDPAQNQLKVIAQAYVQKRATPVGSKTDPDLVEMVRLLAASLGDPEIARILNMKKTTTPRGLVWTRDRVGQFRKQHGILLGTPAANPDSLTGEQAATHLDISKNALRGLIREGHVTMTQVVDFAPWKISKAQLDSEPVRAAVETLRQTRRIPKIRGCPDGQLSIFPASTVVVGKGAL